MTTDSQKTECKMFQKPVKTGCKVQSDPRQKSVHRYHRRQSFCFFLGILISSAAQESLAKNRTQPEKIQKYIQISPEKLKLRLRNIPDKEKVLRCHFSDDASSFTLQTVSDVATEFSGNKLRYHYRTFRQKGTRKKLIRQTAELNMEETVSELFPIKQSEPLHPVFFTFSHDKQKILICKQRDPQKSPEIELWNQEHQSLISYTRSNFRDCSLHAQLSPDRKSIGLSSGKVPGSLIWDLRSGAVRPLHPSVQEHICYGFSEDMQQGFCRSTDGTLKAIELSSGHVIWKATWPESLQPAFYKVIARTVSNLSQQPLPAIFHSLIFQGPDQVYLSKRTESIDSWYRANLPGKPDLFIRHSQTDGEYMQHNQFVLPPQVIPVNSRFFHQTRQIIAEDYNPERKEKGESMMLLIQPEKGIIKRILSPCTDSWDYLPASETLFTCGVCKGRNVFGQITLSDLSPSQAP